MHNFKDEIREMIQSYYHLNQELHEVESELVKLQNKHKQLQKKKTELSKIESNIINKIEKETGKKASLTDLYKLAIARTEV